MMPPKFRDDGRAIRGLTVRLDDAEIGSPTFTDFGEVAGVQHFEV
jgi:hypothetical protein